MKEIGMTHDWNTKKPVPETFKLQDLGNTHARLFVKKGNQSQPHRVKFLVNEETKGRPDNPISGAIHFNNQMIKNNIF